MNVQHSSFTFPSVSNEDNTSLKSTLHVQFQAEDRHMIVEDYKRRGENWTTAGIIVPCLAIGGVMVVVGMLSYLLYRAMRRRRERRRSPVLLQSRLHQTRKSPGTGRAVEMGEVQVGPYAWSKQGARGSSSVPGAKGDISVNPAATHTNNTVTTVAIIPAFDDDIEAANRKRKSEFIEAEKPKVPESTRKKLKTEQNEDSTAIDSEIVFHEDEQICLQRDFSEGEELNNMSVTVNVADCLKQLKSQRNNNQNHEISITVKGINEIHSLEAAEPFAVTESPKPTELSVVVEIETRMAEFLKEAREYARPITQTPESNDTPANSSKMSFDTETPNLNWSVSLNSSNVSELWEYSDGMDVSRKEYQPCTGSTQIMQNTNNFGYQMFKESVSTGKCNTPTYLDMEEFESQTKHNITVNSTRIPKKPAMNKTETYEECSFKSNETCDSENHISDNPNSIAKSDNETRNDARRPKKGYQITGNDISKMSNVSHLQEKNVDACNCTMSENVKNDLKKAKNKMKDQEDSDTKESIQNKMNSTKSRRSYIPVSCERFQQSVRKSQILNQRTEISRASKLEKFTKSGTCKSQKNSGDNSQDNNDALKTFSPNKPRSRKSAKRYERKLAKPDLGGGGDADNKILKTPSTASFAKSSECQYIIANSFKNLESKSEDILKLGCEALELTVSMYNKIFYLGVNVNDIEVYDTIVKKITNRIDKILGIQNDEKNKEMKKNSRVTNEEILYVLLIHFALVEHNKSFYNILLGGIVGSINYCFANIMLKLAETKKQIHYLNSLKDSLGRKSRHRTRNFM